MSNKVIPSPPAGRQVRITILPFARLPRLSRSKLCFTTGIVNRVCRGSTTEELEHRKFVQNRATFQTFLYNLELSSTCRGAGHILCLGWRDLQCHLSAQATALTRDTPEPHRDSGFLFIQKNEYCYSPFLFWDPLCKNVRTEMELSNS